MPVPDAMARLCLLAGRAGSGYNFRMLDTSPAFRVNVLFFGRMRELTGIREDAIDVPPGLTLAALFDRYVARFPQLAGFRASLVASRNQEFAAWDTRLSAGDDIAFLPPVSGG